MARTERETVSETHPLYQDAALYLGPKEGKAAASPCEVAFSGPIVQAIQYAVEKLDQDRRYNSCIVTSSGDKIEWPQIKSMYDRYGMGSFFG